MSVELDMTEVKQEVVGEGIESSMDLASENTEDAYMAFVKEEPTPPSLVSPYQHESLQCFQCFITFCNHKAKERHMRKSHREEYKQQLQQSDTVFSCYVCDRAFWTSVQLTEHQAVHSKEEKPFKCPYCQDCFRTFSEVTSHRRNVCEEKPYSCRYCAKSLRGVQTLRAHRAVCHPELGPAPAPADDGKTHRCGKCGRGFEEEAELLQHQEDHAGERYCNGLALAPPKRRGRPPREAGPADGAKRERLEHPGGGDRAEPPAVAPAKPKGRRGRPPKSTSDVPRERAEVETARHVCPECEASFPAAAQLRAHKREAHGRPAPPRKPHACPDCEESFSRPEQLEAHAARAHSAGRHTCPVCGKSFGRENSLRAHQQTHATADQPSEGGCR